MDQTYSQPSTATQIFASEYGSVTEAPPSKEAKLVADQEWQKTHALLTNNPALMTATVLINALERQAPLDLIRHMLRINPQAASIPKTGPTPLQVAVQNFCSHECVEQLLRACPFASVVKHPGNQLDPLSYAKQFRGTESELIRLLSYPVAYWVQQQSKHQLGTGGATQSPKAMEYRAPRRSRKERKPVESMAQAPRRFLPYGCGHDTTISPTDIASTNTEFLDPKELDNCKIICMAVLKGHKRLSKEILQMQKKIEEVTSEQHRGPNINTVLESHGAKLMKQVQEQNEKMHRTHMIAFEMKEQAMKSHLNRVESRVVKTLEAYKEEAAEKSEVRIASLQSQLLKVSSRMDQMEAKMTNRSPKSKIVMKPKPPPKRIVVPKCMNESFDTCDETDEGECPLPFVFVTPHSANKHANEDSRSLLDRDSFGENPFRRPGSRFLHVLCKNSSAKI